MSLGALPITGGGVLPTNPTFESITIDSGAGAVLLQAGTPDTNPALLLSGDDGISPADAFILGGLFTGENANIGFDSGVTIVASTAEVLAQSFIVHNGTNPDLTIARSGLDPTDMSISSALRVDGAYVMADDYYAQHLGYFMKLDSGTINVVSIDNPASPSFFVWGDDSAVVAGEYFGDMSFTSNVDISNATHIGGDVIIEGTTDFNSVATFNTDANFIGAILLDGDAGTAGQTLTSAGPDKPDTWT